MMKAHRYNTKHYETTEVKTKICFQLDSCGEGSPRAVGHNIYILAHQLSRHDKDLARELKPDTGSPSEEAIRFYEKKTAQIEVWNQTHLK